MTELRATRAPRSSGSPSAGFDVIVVGAGVVGLAVAAAYARAKQSVLILEQKEGIACGITSRSSEVVHAGLYYPRDSLKARFCVEGRERLVAYCRARGVGFRRLGKWVVSTRPEEDAAIEDLAARGAANGVTGLEVVESQRLAREEPALHARRALFSPDSGIVDAHGLCLALLAEAEAGGVTLACRRTLEGLTPRSYGWRAEVTGPGGEQEQVDAGRVVDAAGLDADRIAELAGLDVDALGWRQSFCKGDYFVLASRPPVEIRRLIYPVPSGAGLGIHVTLDLAGRIRFGPDAEYVDDCDFRVDPGKASAFRTAVSRFLPALAFLDFVPDYAGIRPKLAGPGQPFRDFVVEEASFAGAPGFVACIGIESPGLTSALAIGDWIAARY